VRSDGVRVQRNVMEVVGARWLQRWVENGERVALTDSVLQRRKEE
jgi:hypothetical protein